MQQPRYHVRSELSISSRCKILTHQEEDAARSNLDELAKGNVADHETTTELTRRGAVLDRADIKPASGEWQVQDGQLEQITAAHCRL